MATPIDQFYEDKKLLILRIKDLKFVDDVSSEFKCKRCGNVLIQHYISNCGHAFCYNCKKLLGDGSERWKCTECQEYVTEIDVQNDELEQKLFNLRVHCANKNYGCSFSCVLKDLAEHLKACEHTRENALPVVCENGNTIEAILEQIMKFNQKFDKLNLDIESINQKLDTIEIKQEAFDSKLEEMNSRINVVNADLKGETSRIDTEIDNVKNKLEKQFGDAEFRLTDINDYKNLTNKLTETNKIVTVKLKDVEDKVKLIGPQMITLESYINMTKLQVNPILFKDVYLKRAADFVWEINDVKNQLKQNGVTVRSDWFVLKDYPLEAQATIYYSGEEMTVSARFKEPNNAESTIQMMMKLKPCVYLIIRNQVDDRDSDVIRCARKEFGSPLYSDYYFDAVDKYPVTRKRYIQNDALLLEMHVEPPGTCEHVFSYDGTLSWAIENYWKNKGMETYRYVTFHESPYFYTAPNGYRAQVRVCLNYYSNEYCYFYVNFLTGKFDDEIKDEIKHTITVTVINLKCSNGNLIKSEIYDPGIKHSWFNQQKCGGFKIAFTIKDIENVVSNDTLYYRVKIEEN